MQEVLRDGWGIDTSDTGVNGPRGVFQSGIYHLLFDKQIGEGFANHGYELGDHGDITINHKKIRAGDYIITWEGYIIYVDDETRELYRCNLNQSFVSQEMTIETIGELTHEDKLALSQIDYVLVDIQSYTKPYQSTIFDVLYSSDIRELLSNNGYTFRVNGDIRGKHRTIHAGDYLVTSDNIFIYLDGEHRFLYSNNLNDNASDPIGLTSEVASGLDDYDRRQLDLLKGQYYNAEKD